MPAIKGLERAQVLASLAGIELNIKDLVEDWILITYDIPKTIEGNKVRYEFLKKASQIGAVMHTKSVYFMPLTKEAQTEVVNLSKIGKVFIWNSNITDENLKRELTLFYDYNIQQNINLINYRMDRIDMHIKEERFGIAQRMYYKTVELFNDISKAVVQRGSLSLHKQLIIIEEELADLGLMLT
jgi:hypothetical protein